MTPRQAMRIHHTFLWKNREIKVNVFNVMSMMKHYFVHYSAAKN